MVRKFLEVLRGLQMLGHMLQFFKTFYKVKKIFEHLPISKNLNLRLVSWSIALMGVNPPILSGHYIRPMPWISTAEVDEQKDLRGPQLVEWDQVL